MGSGASINSGVPFKFLLLIDAPKALAGAPRFLAKIPESRMGTRVSGCPILMKCHLGVTQVAKHFANYANEGGDVATHLESGWEPLRRPVLPGPGNRDR